MAYYRKIGVFIKVPRPGEVKTRLVPPLSDGQACDLYTAFLKDLFVRLAKLKKLAGTVFYDGSPPDEAWDFIPRGYEIEQQRGANLGERMLNAFRHMLAEDGSMAVLIGSDSPDIPLRFIKRAYLKLKHKDIVLGPSADGGYYLVGLKRIVEPVFTGVQWSRNTVLAETLHKVQSNGLTCSTLPLWYDVDDAKGLSLLESLVLARQIERSDRLHHVEKVLANIARPDSTM